MGRILPCLGISILLLFLFSFPRPVAAYDQKLLTSPQVKSIPKHFRYQLALASPTPSPSRTPTRTPTPIRKKIIKMTIPPTTVTQHPPTNTPPPQQSAQGGIIGAINAYRASKGLAAVKNNTETCAFAKTRAQEITNAFNHDGFTIRISANTLPYPGYSAATENIAQTGDVNQVVPMWIASPGHAKNMEADTPYVCVESSGEYYAYEGWKP